MTDFKKVFVGKNKNINIVNSSSSGGAFSAIVHEFFSKFPDNGVVYGCKMNSELRAVHICAFNENDCNPFYGSKYIRSKLGDSFHRIEDQLNNGLSVLFSGTPCQIFSLKSYLNRKNIDSSRLFTIDVVCHGVARDDFFRDYISYLESKYKGRAIECKFRAKVDKYSLQDMLVKFDNGKVYHASSTKYDWFYSLYNNNNLENSCYQCRFASRNRNSDITLADAWGSKYVGYTMIMINTEKGEKLINDHEMDLISCSIEDFNHPGLDHPAIKPDDYETFWSIYKNEGFMAAQKYVGNNTVKGKMRSSLVDIAYKMKIKELVKKMWRL